MPERGEVRPASDDYALYADEIKNRGKLLPCPGCGDAPDHVEDDPKCVSNRARAVRVKQIELERLHQLREQEDELTEEETAFLKDALAKLMVD